MPNEPGPKLLAEMKQAARMRAAGQSWAAIEKKLKRRPRTCCTWASRHAPVWAQLYSDALAERDDDAEAESIGTLREMLRVQDVRVQREAARELLRLIRRNDRRIRAAAEADRSLGTITDESLATLIRALDPQADGAARSGS